MCRVSALHLHLHLGVHAQQPPCCFEGVMCSAVTPHTETRKRSCPDGEATSNGLYGASVFPGDILAAYTPAMRHLQVRLLTYTNAGCIPQAYQNEPGICDQMTLHIRVRQKASTCVGGLVIMQADSICSGDTIGTWSATCRNHGPDAI